MTDRTPEEDEDEDNNGVVTKGNAFWGAGYHAREREDTFTGSFRGVPTIPHGGAAAVTEPAHGSVDLCWCGLPLGHNWPGKAIGLRHPRKGQPVTTGATEEEAQTKIQRRSLRAYHADLADVIMAAVNDYQAKYRATNNGIVLFPPDGSQPYTIHARNSDRQVKGARMWFVRHCASTADVKKAAKKAAKKAESGSVTTEELKELAATINSEEHPVAEDAETPEADPETGPETGTEPASEPATDESTGSVTEPDSEPEAEAEWVPYIPNKSKGGTEPHPHMETNGVDVRCTIDGWVGKPVGVGGHVRTRHRDTNNFWGGEARAKAIETARVTKVSHQVAQAIEILQQAIGVDPAEQAAMEQMLEENDRLRLRVAELEAQAADYTAKIADQEARMALAREAFGL